MEVAAMVVVVMAVTIPMVGISLGQTLKFLVKNMYAGLVVNLSR